ESASRRQDCFEEGEALLLDWQNVAGLSMRGAEIEWRQVRAAGKMIRSHAGEVAELERERPLRPQRGDGDPAGEQVVVSAGEFADLPGQVFAHQGERQRRALVQFVPKLEAFEGGEDGIAHGRLGRSV